MRSNHADQNLRYIAKICLITLVAIILFLVVFYVIGEVAYDVYETDDPRNYGRYPANRKEEDVEAFLGSFFPETIESYFTDVSYHYRAGNISRYAMDAYLEFTIEDDALFTQFLSEYVDYENCTVFPYDDRFMEYIPSDPSAGVLYDEYFVSKQKRDDGGYWLYYAKIGKILFSEDNNRVIFIALWAEDSSTVDYGYFFSRFKIDPHQYKGKG